MLFNPRSSVRARLEQASSPTHFQIVSLEKLLELLAKADKGAIAA
jgi:hypothetical protein